MARIPNINKEFYLKVKEKFPNAKPLSGDLLKSSKQLDKIIKDNEKLLDAEIDNHAESVQQLFDDFVEREKSLNSFIKKYSPKKTYPKTKRKNKTSRADISSISSISISHPSVGKIESPSDFDRVVNDNSIYAPPHTYDLSSKSGIKKYRKDMAVRRSQNEHSKNKNESTKLADVVQPIEPIKNKIKPNIRPKIFNESDLPFSNNLNNLSYGRGDDGVSSRVVNPNRDKVLREAKYKRLQKAIGSDIGSWSYLRDSGLLEKFRSEDKEFQKNGKERGSKNSSNDGSSIVAKIVNITASKVVGLSGVNASSKSKSEEDKVNNDAKGYSSELLKLTTKVVVSKLLLPKVDPDVRLLIALLFKPVSKQISSMFGSIGKGVKTFFRNRKLKSVMGIKSNITDTIKNKVSSIKIGERFETFKGFAKNAIGLGGKGVNPIMANKSMRQKYNEVTQSLKTTDNVTSGEDPQMGKVRRSYGIFFNYLNNKSNIFKGSINKVFDTMASRTLGFGKSFNKILGTFNKLKEWGSKKGGAIGWIFGLFTKIFGKGGLIGKLGGGLMKIVKLAGTLLASLGLGKLFKGKLPDFNPRGGRGASSASRGGFIKKAWESTKGLGKKVMGSTLGKLGGKTLGKSLLKKIPIIGALAGLGFGLQRLLKGDVVGAGMEVASGASSIIPVGGTALSLGIDGALMARDANKNDELDVVGNDPADIVVARRIAQKKAYLERLKNDSGVEREFNVREVDGKLIYESTYKGTIKNGGDFINKTFDESKQYNINKDARGKELSSAPIVIDQSSMTSGGSGSGGFLNGANEPLIVDPRNNILTQVMLNSLSKGVV